ncbi:6-carboxytetrahydropterin synthase [candidate division WOR-3 bacterium]|nr:6-carboxytetrahydropterin synthase [candidate division WOR-3 bacterium]
MFEVEVTVPLKFRHHLAGFADEFARPHEHTWDVTVTTATESLDQRGVSVDFVKLKENLARSLEPFQGKLLNSIPPFDDTPPTAEGIARWVADLIAESYPGLVRAVTVGTDEERARYIL